MSTTPPATCSAPSPPASPPRTSEASPSTRPTTTSISAEATGRSTSSPPASSTGPDPHHPAPDRDHRPRGTLHAKVDPEGFAVTDCHFDWVDDAHYDAQARRNPYAAGAHRRLRPSAGSRLGLRRRRRLRASPTSTPASPTTSASSPPTRPQRPTGTSEGPDQTLDHPRPPGRLPRRLAGHRHHGDPLTPGSTRRAKPPPTTSNTATSRRPATHTPLHLGPGPRDRLRARARRRSRSPNDRQPRPRRHLPLPPRRHQRRRHLLYPRRDLHHLLLACPLSPPAPTTNCAPIPAPRLRRQPARLPRLRAGLPGRQGRRQRHRHSGVPDPGGRRRRRGRLRRRRRPPDQRRHLQPGPLRRLAAAPGDWSTDGPPPARRSGYVGPCGWAGTTTCTPPQRRSGQRSGRRPLPHRRHRRRPAARSWPSRSSPEAGSVDFDRRSPPTPTTRSSRPAATAPAPGAASGVQPLRPRPRRPHPRRPRPARLGDHLRRLHPRPRLRPGPGGSFVDLTCLPAS